MFPHKCRPGSIVAAPGSRTSQPGNGSMSPAVCADWRRWAACYFSDVCGGSWHREGTVCFLPDGPLREAGGGLGASVAAHCYL